MDRPFTVCHLLTSLDGRLEGNFWETSEALVDAAGEYARIRREYDADAAIYGSVTMGETYTERFAEIDDRTPAGAGDDFICNQDAGKYFVSIDPYGTVGYDDGYMEKRGNPRAHIIEVVTGRAPKAYLEYLRDRGVSYVFAGADEVDFRLVLEKLKNIFGVEKVLIAGGGKVDHAFLKAGLIDELCMVIAPAAEPVTARVHMFDCFNEEEKNPPVTFELKSVESTENDLVVIRYIPKNRR